MAEPIKWHRIIARGFVALLGLFITVVAQYQPYVMWAELRWWEVYGQLIGGVAMIFLAFMPDPER